MVVAVVSDVFDVHSSGDDPLLLLEDSQLVGLDGKPGLLPPQPVLTILIVFQNFFFWYAVQRL